MMIYYLLPLCLAAFTVVIALVNLSSKVKSELIGRNLSNFPLFTFHQVMLDTASHTTKQILFIVGPTFSLLLKMLQTPSLFSVNMSTSKILFVVQGEPCSSEKMVLILLIHGLIPSFFLSWIDLLVVTPHVLVVLPTMRHLAFPNQLSWPWVTGHPKLGKFISMIILLCVTVQPSSLLHYTTIKPQLLATSLHRLLSTTLHYSLL